MQEQIKDEDFRREYDFLKLEYEFICSLIDAGKLRKITQKELSDATGIAQSDISKIENGSGNPTVKILQRLADGLGMNLKIEFVAKEKVLI